MEHYQSSCSNNFDCRCLALLSGALRGLGPVLEGMAPVTQRPALPVITLRNVSPWVQGSCPVRSPADAGHVHCSVDASNARVQLPCRWSRSAWVPPCRHLRRRSVCPANQGRCVCSCALVAAIGEPATFHVLDAHVEPLSVWTSAVLRIGWDLMGSEDVAAPTHIWFCYEPNMSGVCTGRSSESLTGQL